LSLINSGMIYSEIEKRHKLNYIRDGSSGNFGPVSQLLKSAVVMT